MSAVRCLTRLLKFSQPSSYDSLCQTWGGGQNKIRCGIFSRVSGEAVQVQQFRFLLPFPAALLPWLKSEYIAPLRKTVKYGRVKTNELFLNYDELKKVQQDDF